MDATDRLRGGERHEPAVDPGDDRGLDGEWVPVRPRDGGGGSGEEVALFVPSDADRRPDIRTGETDHFHGVWGCTPVSPVAGGADATRDRAGVASDD